MTKFIEYDIHNGVTQLRVAIMNILHGIVRGEIDKYTCYHLPYSLILDSLISIGMHFDCERRTYENYTIRVYNSENKLIMIIDFYNESGEVIFKRNEI